MARRRRRQRRGGNQRAREHLPQDSRTGGAFSACEAAVRHSPTPPCTHPLTLHSCGAQKGCGGAEDLGIKAEYAYFPTLTPMLQAMTTAQLKEELKTCLDRECRTRMACKRRCLETQDLALHRARESIKKHKKPATVIKYIKFLKAHDESRAEQLLTPGIIDAVQRLTKPETADDPHRHHHHHHHE